MSGSRLTWLVACGGACWTWLLASWGGVSPMTSLWRAATVFVMLAAVLTVVQAVLPALQHERPQPEEKRPAPPQASEEEASPQRDAA